MVYECISLVRCVSREEGVIGARPSGVGILVNLPGKHKEIRTVKRQFQFPAQQRRILTREHPEIRVPCRLNS